VGASMAVKILSVAYHAIWKQEPKFLIAVADFGDGEEVEIPLPAHFLSDDDQTTLENEAAQGMENLAKALLEYARRRKKKRSPGRRK
jgi:hypothetical protein